MEEITIIRPDDFHVHLRQPEDLSRGTLLPTAQAFGRALVMPNLSPSVLTAQDALQYKAAIEAALPDLGLRGQFTPLMTIQIVDATTPETIHEAKSAGVTAGKLYPVGVTTNSHNGVTDIFALAEVFREMERCGMVLCLHGESPGMHCMDREKHFLNTLESLVLNFPKLRIVLEHITTVAAVDVVEALPDTVGATITAHHLLLTLDDVVGDRLQPHNFCKPIPKYYRDRDLLVMVATDAHPKFFFGSDSAPHRRIDKECDQGCAGVFSAPSALALLATIFEKNRSLHTLETFVSKNGAAFYGLPVNTGTITLRKEPWRVPEESYGRLPFMAGKTLPWKLSY